MSEHRITNKSINLLKGKKRIDKMDEILKKINANNHISKEIRDKELMDLKFMMGSEK